MSARRLTHRRAAAVHGVVYDPSGRRAALRSAPTSEANVLRGPIWVVTGSSCDTRLRPNRRRMTPGGDRKSTEQLSCTAPAGLSRPQGTSRPRDTTLLIGARSAMCPVLLGHLQSPRSQADRVQDGLHRNTPLDQALKRVEDAQGACTMTTLAKLITADPRQPALAEVC
jgi:hypothetical protein